MTDKSRDQHPMSPITDVLADLHATSRWQERVYKQLHEHPELSFQETKTAALAASKLKELGYEVLEGIGRTGVEETLHIRSQACHVESAMFHADIDVVGPGPSIGPALCGAQHVAGMVADVVDGLILG